MAIAIETRTLIHYSAPARDAREQALRERFNTAVEQAVQAYLDESMQTDVSGIELFPGEWPEDAA